MDFVDEFYADKDLSLLKKLTLVIPTYNRNYYLNRCLWYHAHFPFGEIIVADSSPEEKKVVNRETVAKVREQFGANVRYLEYEPENEKYGGDIYRKWGDAVQHVETEYSQFCADKEFEIPITQCRCIEYLDEHRDYSIAEGVNYLITQNREKGYTYTSWQSQGSLPSNDACARLAFTIQNNVCPLMGIYNFKVQKETYQNYIKYNIDDLRFGEAVNELQAIISGKYKRFPDRVLTCRDITQSTTNNHANLSMSSTMRYPKIWEYSEKYYQDKYSAFKLCIYDSLLHNSSDNPDDILELLESYLPRYLHHRFYPPSSPLDNYLLIKKIWGKMPRGIRNKFNHINTGYNYEDLKPDACLEIINKIMQNAIVL